MRYPSLLIGNLVIATLLGCSPSFNTKSNILETETLDANGSTDWEASTGLHTLLDEMSTDYCDNIQPGVAGATSYFYGIYQQSDTGWKGEEQWILHPTDSWISTGGETCYVTWAMEATEQSVAGCPSCDFALEVSATLNRQKTDCPDGLWEDEEQWSTTYNVLVDGSNSIVYFQSDGEVVGEGYSNTTAFNFLSEVSCSWF